MSAAAAEEGAKTTQWVLVGFVVFVVIVSIVFIFSPLWTRTRTDSPAAAAAQMETTVADSSSRVRVSFAPARLTRLFWAGVPLTEDKGETFVEPDPGPGLNLTRAQFDPTPRHGTHAPSRPPFPLSPLLGAQG